MDRLKSRVAGWTGVSRRRQTEEARRSRYSLVSSGELTPAAVELWRGLPDQVKYDAALAPFRRVHDRERGELDDRGTLTKVSNKASVTRLPSVNSAPTFNNNLHIVDESLPYITPNNNNKHHDKGIEMPFPSPNSGQTQNKTSKLIQKSLYYVKMSMLLACWFFFTIIFMTCNEKEVVTRQSYILPGETKVYPLRSTNTGLSVSITMKGPFLPELIKLNETQIDKLNKMTVWIMKTDAKGNVQNSKPWTVLLDETVSMDFSVGETRSTLLEFDETDTVADKYSVQMNSTSDTPLPFSMQYTENPLNKTIGVILSLLLLVGLYVLIIFEITSRALSAALVSLVSLAALSLAGERPSLPELVSWLDVETLLLLFSMMLLVALTAETGMFDYLAVFTFSVTKGQIWPLIILLCTITALLSTVLDNVTTVLLMTPVTIRLCEVMELTPTPVLVSMVLYSNIGGTATPVGDPPNVIIASNRLVIESGIHFTNFTIHMTLGILLVCVQTYLQLRFMYRDINKLKINVPSDVQNLRQQITLWRRASSSLPHLGDERRVVKSALDDNVKKLSEQLDARLKEARTQHNKHTYDATLANMKDKLIGILGVLIAAYPAYKIRDRPLLISSLISIFFVVAIFFLHSFPEMRRISLGWTALLGAVLLLILADRDDLESILNRVEWSTLLFFASLFVLMEALSKLGLIEFIGSCTEYVIMSVDESYRLATALLLILWVSGLCSAFVDNIPLTTMMVRVVTSLGANPHVGLPLAPLIWALALGACLGGNGTLIGASANVVCAGVSEQHGYRISFGEFFWVGFPIMIGHLLVATVYLLLCHCVFSWH